MNYEEIIERLLEEKHISAKEAVCLLKQCNSHQEYTQFPTLTLTQPNTSPRAPWEPICTFYTTDTL